YALNPLCSAVAAGPVAPRGSRGVCGSAGNFDQVCGPTIPSNVKPFPDWKFFTAASVGAPKLPSIRSKDRILSSTSSRCRRLTSAPVDPLLSVGPVFIAIAPLDEQGSNRNHDVARR